MIKTSYAHSECPNSWQSKFIEMLPEIEKLLAFSFSHFAPEARANACEEGLFHCVWSYSRLFEQGRAEATTPNSLVWFAMLQVRGGRVAGCPLNGREVMSRYAQKKHGFKVEALGYHDSDDDGWIADTVDSRQSPILDQVAAKLDFVSWLGGLCRRTRRIALDLAQGLSTSEAAQKHGVTPGRISQLRRELQTSWCEFQGEPVTAGAR